MSVQYSSPFPLMPPHASTRITLYPELHRASALAALNHESPPTSFLSQTRQPTWRPLTVMFPFPPADPFPGSSNHLGASKADQLASSFVSKEETRLREQGSSSSSKDGSPLSSYEEIGVEKTPCSTEKEELPANVLVETNDEEEHSDDEKDEEQETAAMDSEHDTVILSDSEPEDANEKKFESRMWNIIYGDVAGYETDIVEINDDNYIYLDDLLTEYDFTEYEPASPSSSEPYSDSDSEPCLQHFRGTLPYRNYDTSDDDAGDSPKWACSKCTFLNEPLAYRCGMCMERRRTKHMPRALQRDLSKAFPTLETGCSSRSQDSGIELSQSHCPPAQLEELQPNKNCVVCLVKPVSTSLVHRGTAHLICCYKCARKLMKRGKPCPICRRPIRQVVLTFTS